MHRMEDVQPLDEVPGGGERKMPQRQVDYVGGGVDFTRSLGQLAYGGQVVLTETAWVSVQDHLPGQAQVSPKPSSAGERTSGL